MSYIVLTTYQRRLQMLALCLIRHKSAVIITWLVILALSCTGFVRWHGSKLSPDDQFILSDIQSRLDIKRASVYFPLLGARQEEVILVPRAGDNVLSKECLEEASAVHNTILNTEKFEASCVKQFSSSTKKSADKCFFLSPLELIDSRMDQLDRLPNLLAKEWRRKRSNFSTVHFNFKETLSAFTVSGNSSVFAKAMRMLYFVQAPKNDSEKKATDEMEKRLALQLTSFASRMKCSSLSFVTCRMLDEVTADILSPKSWPLAISAVVLFLGGILLTKFSRRYFSYLNVFFITCCCVALALLCSLGILTFLGLPFAQTFWFLPFLLLGSSTTNALLIVRELENQLHSPSFEFRLSSCLAKTGLLLIATTATNLFLFGVAMRSSFPGVVYFFLLAFLAVCFTFLSILTLFPVLLTLNIKRIKSIVRLACWGETESVHRTTSYSIISHELVKEVRVSPFFHLQGLPGKFLALILVLGFVPVFSFFALKPGERLNTSLYLHQGKNIRNLQAARAKFFDGKVDVSLVLSSDISSETGQYNLLQVSRPLGNTPFGSGPSSSWVNTIRKWGRDHEMNCTGRGLHSCLLALYKAAPHHPLWKDVVFQSPNASVIASRFQFYIKLTNEFSSNVKALSSLREELSARKLQTSTVSQEFIGLEELMVFKQELILILCISAAFIFVSTCFFTVSPIISFLLTSGFFLQVLEAIALVFLCKVPFNQLSFPSFFAIVVFSFSHSSYVAQRFVVSSKESSREGALDAVVSCFPAVLSGGVLTILGSFGLGFVFPHLGNLFQAVFPSVLLLGLIHAFLILPPLLSLTGYHLKSLTSKTIELTSEGKQTYVKNKELPAQKRKPKHPGISLVGISCKFPRAENKLQFWDMLVNGGCAVRDNFPSNRPEEHAMFYKFFNPKKFVSGRLVAVGGAYLENIRGFDAKFFGISPQEANSMDPQQRILLQVVYEAIEDAGQRLEDLQKCRTGVFLGVMNLDYKALVTNQSNLGNINQFASTGITAPILANRISFCLNLTGPSLSVDTACSSSLAALKLACVSLHERDCEVAIVCAPNLVLSHEMQVRKRSSL